ncbi:M14 family zinc carboxypeptidase [Actinomycetota bacterium]
MRHNAFACRRAALAATVAIASLAVATPAVSAVSQVPTATDTNAAVPAPVRIGTSVRGRAINAYRIGDPTAVRKRVIIGQLHGNEKAGYKAAWQLINTSRPTGLDIWVIPTANPDGYAANTRGNARGVDINRNFSKYWAYVYRPGSGYYQGPAPWSEPETRAVRDFLNRVRPWEAAIYHQPLYGIDRYGLKNRGLHDRLVASTGQPSKSFACDGVCRGTAQTWYNGTYSGSLITIEFGSAPTATQISKAAYGTVSAMRM